MGNKLIIYIYKSLVFRCDFLPVPNHTLFPCELGSPPAKQTIIYMPERKSGTYLGKKYQKKDAPNITEHELVHYGPPWPLWWL